MKAKPATQDLQTEVDTVAYARMLGVELRDDGEELLARLVDAPHLIGNPQVQSQHGGAIASLLQITARSKLMKMMNASCVPRLFSCSIEYLSSARGGDTCATATVMSRSRRYANVRAQAFQGGPDQLIATATVQFLLVD